MSAAPPLPSATPSNRQPTARQYAYLFCDLVNSTGLKSELNAWKYVCDVLEPHDQLFRRLLADYPESHEIKHLGDGFLAIFNDVRDAIAFALRFQAALQAYRWNLDSPDQSVQTRIGIDVGMAVIKLVDDRPIDVFGPNVDLASRVMSAADGGRVLLTATAYDLAQAAIPFVEMNLREAGLPEARLRLARHGAYRIQGVTEPVILCEACLGDIEPQAPASKPPKVINVGDEGWSPESATGEINPEDIPDRPGWKLVRKLGEGSFGRAYLGIDSCDSQNERVFKFCRDDRTADTLRNERELLQRIQHLKRRDIVAYLGAHLERPPYFLEFEYVSGGNLIEWAQRAGGLPRINFSLRLELCAQIAASVAAAHRERVFHLDLKPSNILLERQDDGRWQTKITDFGIGAMEIDGQLSPRSGSSRSSSVGSSERTPRHLYVAPEASEGVVVSGPEGPATSLDVRDVYALGVLLFQMSVGDLRRPLAPSALRLVSPQLLREDIEQATHFDPARRLTSAAELEDRIRHLTSRERRRFLLRSFMPACATLLAISLLLGVACLGIYRMYLTTRQAERHALLAREAAIQSQQAAEREYQDKLTAITSFWSNIDRDDESSVFRALPGEAQQQQVLQEIRTWLLAQAEKDLAKLRFDRNDLDHHIAYARLTLRISQLLDDGNLDAREQRLNAGLAALAPSIAQQAGHPELELLQSDLKNQLGQVAFQKGNVAAALTLFEECLSLRRQLWQRSLQTPEAFSAPSWEYERKYLSSVHNLALLRLSMAAGQSKISQRSLSDEAEQHAAILELQSALDGRLRLATAHPESSALLRDLGSSQFTFGRMLRQRAQADLLTGHAEDAAEWATLARDSLVGALASFTSSQRLDSSTINRQRVVETLRELVDFELEQGNDRGAAGYRDQMVEQVALALPSLVRDLNARAYFTEARFSLVRYQSTQRPEDRSQAVADLRLAGRLYQTLVQLEPENTLFWGDLGTIHYDLGRVLLNSGTQHDLQQSGTELRASLAAWREVRERAPQLFQRRFQATFEEVEQLLLKQLDQQPVQPTPTL